METLNEVSTVVLSELGDAIPGISIDSQGMPVGDDPRQVAQTDNAGSAINNDALDNELVKDSQIAAFRMENPLMYDVLKKMIGLSISYANINEPVPALPQTQAATQQMQATTTTQTQLPTPPQSQPTAETGGRSGAGMERFLAPPRSTSGVNNAPEVFTNQQIEQFYRAVAAGRYRGREKDARDIELRIARAVNEGRVTN
ncbi:hypothetical protein MBAV_003990 [Candidatus Magnetobacterium bavaricum]|uniref:Uncharacterized protein n=1 Tax=Candidatus Magnetobacterium bavaricum TaxID=29290 RepID=A0A0F3GPH9_9BACT|nr:hypothetical protein MBAV_003990 [Candidatus Magnetobacterium bavaricum]